MKIYLAIYYFLPSATHLACIIVSRFRLISLMDIKQLFWFFYFTVAIAVFIFFLCHLSPLLFLPRPPFTAPSTVKWKMKMFAFSKKPSSFIIVVCVTLCIVPTHLFSGERTNVKAKRQWQFFNTEEEVKYERQASFLSFTFIHSRLNRRRRKRNWTGGDLTEKWKFN